MKKLDTTPITTSVGFPPKEGTWQHLQEAHQETTSANLRGQIRGMTADSSQAYILHGCEYRVSSGNYTVTAGAIFYNGEVYLVDAVSSTTVPTLPTKVIAKITTTYFTNAIADPVTMSDTSTENMHEIRKIVIENGTSSTTGYIADFVGMPYAPNSGATEDSYTTGVQFFSDRNYYGDLTATTGANITFAFYTNTALGSRIVLKGTVNNTYSVTATTGSTDTIDVIKISDGSITNIGTSTTGDIIPTVGSNTDFYLEIEYVGKMGTSNHYVTIKAYY